MGEKRQQPDFPYPYRAQDGRETLANAAVLRVVRGGSWDRNQNLARAAYRNQNTPANRSSNDGFRVVVRCPQSHLEH